MAPPTRRTVLLDTVVALAAYGPALAAVTLFEPTASREGAIAGGVLVWVALYPALYLAVFQRRPEILGRRPWRYSLPNAVALLGATSVYWVGLDPTTTFAIVFALLIAGQGLSQLWWSVAASNAEAEAPA